MSGTAWWMDIDYRCAVRGCDSRLKRSVVYKRVGMAENIGWQIDGACRKHSLSVVEHVGSDDDSWEPRVMSGDLAKVMSWLARPDRKLAFISIATPSA